MNEQLRAHLLRHFTDADDIVIEGLAPIPGGFSRETYRFDAHVHRDGTVHVMPMILRKDPDPAAALLQTSRQHDTGTGTRSLSIFVISTGSVLCVGSMTARPSQPPGFMDGNGRFRERSFGPPTNAVKMAHMPGVTKRTTKASEVRYDARVRGPEGEVRTRTFRTVRDAERWRREQLTAKDRHEWIDPQNARTTLDDYAARWLDNLMLRGSTKRIYADNLRLHILPVLGRYPLGRLAPMELRSWLANVAEKPALNREGALAPATVNQIYRALHKVLETAVADGMIRQNPLTSISPPKGQPETMRFLTADELATLAEAIAPAYKALVFTAGYGGLRLGELAGLRKHRVDLLRRRLVIVEQLTMESGGKPVVGPVKTKAGNREVPVSRPLARVLEAHLGEWSQSGRDGYVFTSPAGGPLEANNFRRRYWMLATSATGLDGLRIHDLRHTAASLAISAGASIKVVQSMLGHTSAAMTLDLYGHLFPEDLDRVADQLGAVMDGARVIPNATAEQIR